MTRKVCTTPYILHQIGDGSREETEEGMRTEAALLRACKVCYASIERLRRVMGRNGMDVGPEVMDRIRELGREHLNRKERFQETLLTRCHGGPMQLELGKTYMHRCMGGMRDPDGILFVCGQQTVSYYLKDVRVKPPEEPPQSI